jgi:hypothetical protein
MASLNPPICPGCGEKVSHARNNPRHDVWHGECYGKHSAELWSRYQAAQPLTLYSHDDRVVDGLEWP